MNRTLPSVCITELPTLTVEVLTPAQKRSGWWLAQEILTTALVVEMCSECIDCTFNLPMWFLQSDSFTPCAQISKLENREDALRLLISFDWTIQVVVVDHYRGKIQEAMLGRSYSIVTEGQYRQGNCHAVVGAK